jgi:hypothetical protein
MVFGQLADSVPIFGSQRRAYVFIRRMPRRFGHDDSRRRRRWLDQFRQ